MNNYQEKCVSQTSNEDEIVMNTKTNTTPNLKGANYFNERGLNEKTMIADYENPLSKQKTRKNFQNNPYVKNDNKWGNDKVYNTLNNERHHNPANFSKNDSFKNKNFKKKRKDFNYNSNSEDYYFNTAGISNSNNYRNNFSNNYINQNNPSITTFDTPNTLTSANKFTNNSSTVPFNQYVRYGSNESNSNKHFNSKLKDKVENINDSQGNFPVNFSSSSIKYDNGGITPQYNMFSNTINQSSNNKFNQKHVKQNNQPCSNQFENNNNNSSLLTVESNVQTNYNSNEPAEELNSSKTLTNESSGLTKRNEQDVASEQKQVYFNYDLSPLQMNLQLNNLNDPFMFKGNNNFNTKKINFNEQIGQQIYQQGSKYRVPNTNNVNFNQQNFFLLYDQNLIQSNLPQNININNKILIPHDKHFNIGNNAQFDKTKFYNNIANNNFPQPNMMNFIPPSSFNKPFSNTPPYLINQVGLKPKGPFNQQSQGYNRQKFTPSGSSMGINSNNGYNRNSNEFIRASNNQRNVVQPQRPYIAENITRTTTPASNSNLNENTNCLFKNHTSEDFDMDVINNQDEIAAGVDKQDQFKTNTDHDHYIKIMIKVSEEETKTLKLSKNEDIMSRIKEFCDKFNIQINIILPIYEKVMQALNVIDSIQNSDLDNYKVFTDAYEYLTNKEKWDDLKLGEEYELNTSTPNIQTETSVLFEGDNLNETTFN